MTITENIQRDLDKAKARLTNIDIEIAVLQEDICGNGNGNTPTS